MDQNFKEENNLLENVKDYILSKGVRETFIIKIGNIETLKAINVMLSFQKDFKLLHEKILYKAMSYTYLNSRWQTKYYY